ncbi:alkaline phosphatase D family protein [Alteromonas facilis]|uniref:alkaline phosphatase D family protein n=1 Tax=Alteromonas facilis TaxID=2048004 RepID=UPI000C291E01|nr:alkaline phosphatase D family protein [Alteromonas facilis]
MRLVVALVSILSTCNVLAEPHWPKGLTHFAVGSCAKDRQPQPIWNSIADTEPELFLFIGDNVYADAWIDEQGESHSVSISDPALITAAYQRLAAHSEFDAFRRKVPIMATWDDHDFGLNDGGKEFLLKDASQQAFMAFFDFAEDAPIRQRAGVYNTRVFADEVRRVQVIMLDTRYHRDRIDKRDDGRPPNKGPFLPTSDTSRSMLGEQQWRWLEVQLRQPADLRFIISSVQVVAYEHAWETWGNMPHEREKLFKLIDETDASGVIFLSGDRHLTEVSVDAGQLGSAVPYPMWDFTASGLTDEYNEVNEVNSFRKGSVHRQANFGTVKIDWQTPVGDTTITMTAFDIEGNALNQQSVRLGSLRE